MITLYFVQMERSDVSEVQDFWKTDEGQAGGKGRGNEIRRVLLFQVGNSCVTMEFLPQNEFH